MYVNDGIAYADELAPGSSVQGLRPIGEHRMLVTFSTGETRLFDATELLEFPAFEPLADEAVFSEARIDHGIITWLGGEIDISSEKAYEMSCEYDTAE